MGSTTVSPDHEFVVAGTFFVSHQQAKHAANRGSVWLREQTRADVMDLYCNNCRRPYDEVVDEKCSAASSTEHLRGGPIGERKKRTAAAG